MRRTPALLACAISACAMFLPTQAAAADAEREAVDALNDVRRANGLPALRVSPTLNRTSGRYARRMLRLDYFGHGSGVHVGGAFSSAGETIAWHGGWRARPRRTVGSWMRSPGHRALLLSPGYRKVGIGLARGRLGSRIATTWVAHVGTP